MQQLIKHLRGGCLCTTPIKDENDIVAVLTEKRMKHIFPSCERLTTVCDFHHWENMFRFVRIWVGHLLDYNGEEGRWKKEMASLPPRVAWAVCAAHGTLGGEQHWPHVQGGLPCSLPPCSTHVAVHLV